MITALEAKQLYDESGAAVDQFLRNEVEPKVVDAAKSGKRSTFIFLGTTGPYEYIDQKLTPLNRAALDKLIKLGYKAHIAHDGEKYVPRGLADDDGNGPDHQNYGLHVVW